MTPRSDARRTPTSTAVDGRPLVVHVVYRFDTGGLENGVVNLLNHMPAERYRHKVVALTEVSDFRLRIARTDVECIALRKPPGHGIWQFAKLYRLFRRLRPQIVHSRNLAALEAQLPAWAAGVPVRIHGEHGRDMGDLDGSNRSYQRVRRLYRPFVHHYLALSRDLASYLAHDVRVLGPRPPDREIAAAQFFPLDALPGDTSAATLARIAEVFHGAARSPYW